jgi:PAS domain S-box-containing protein
VSEIELRQVSSAPHDQSEVGQQHQQEQLRASELRKTAVFEAALDCIITIDHEGWIVEFNAAAERVFGYSREQAIGNLMANLIMPPEHRQPCMNAFMHHLATGKCSVLGHRIERPAMRADGTIIQTEMAITRIDLPGEHLQPCALGEILERIGHRLHERHAQKQARKIGERGIEGKAARLHLVRNRHGARSVARRHALEQAHQAYVPP